MQFGLFILKIFVYDFASFSYEITAGVSPSWFG
jgi:hypothetical protein